jgi:putative SOS response-associated peptidase YedK
MGACKVITTAYMLYRVASCDLGARHPLLLAWTVADGYICGMCGKVIQSSGPLRYAIVDGMNVRDSRVHNYPARWNAAPSQELLVIRRNHQTGDVSLDPVRLGLIPYWCSDTKGGRKPINAKCETVRDLPTFRDAYRRRRCIVPVDGFFEWKAITGQKAKQPYAIAMKDGAPFGIAGILGELERSRRG